MFFFKQKTAYEMRISDWSSDVCSSDLQGHLDPPALDCVQRRIARSRTRCACILTSRRRLEAQGVVRPQDHRRTERVGDHAGVEMPQPNGVNIARIDAGMDNCLLCRRRDKAFNRIPGQLPKCGMSPANDICLNLDLGHLQPRIVLGMGSLGSGEWADHPNHCRWKL